MASLTQQRQAEPCLSPKQLTWVPLDSSLSSEKLVQKPHKGRMIRGNSLQMMIWVMLQGRPTGVQILDRSGEHLQWLERKEMVSISSYLETSCGAQG